MTLTFYHVPNSTSNSTSAVLAELNHPLSTPIHTRIELSLEAGDTRTPSYLSSINPNGQVPAIVHDNVPIWESAAITMYLGETFGVNSGLYPALGPQRGAAMKWIVWTNVKLAEAAGQLYAALMAGDHTPEEKEGIKKKALEDLGKGLSVLDGGLKGREYLLDQGYSLADTHTWTFVRWLTFMQVDLSPYENVTGWMQRVGTRPALVEEIRGE